MHAFNTNLLQCMKNCWHNVFALQTKWQQLSEDFDSPNNKISIDYREILMFLKHKNELVFHAS